MVTDADARFLFGESEGKVGRFLLGRALKRALNDSGAGEIMQQVGLPVESLPDEGLPVGFTPDWARDLLQEGEALDVVGILARQFEERIDDDRRFENATDRWRKVPDRVQGYIPGDAGSVRWPLLPSSLRKPFDFSRGAVEFEKRSTHVIGGSYAYLSTPFFVPAKRRTDVVTATPPVPRQREEIRLPRRYAMVFHDGVPVSLLSGTDDQIDAFEEGSRIMRDDTLIIGGVLAANDDMSVDDSLGFVIMAGKAPEGTYGSIPIPVPMSLNSPASDVLWNYAALMAWEDWGVPARLPETRGKEKSRGYYRTIARSLEGQQGAYQGVRVLNYRPPTLKELKDAEDAGAKSRRELRYQHERRAYWKRRMRVGIRDENDQLVGPVYGPDAVEGVTFERKGKLIPRSIVREDLPERPSGGDVYRFPGTIQHT